ncbi:structural maintenance of chromosomes protein 2-2-like isoform X1 [Magnolia sinica]|uniref:structural maintenance of chromosomes protein 2-2-like isoform X1 n=1 Tax=Magnolia sinica TaxID=86752 RepID=UPI00265B0ED3|nr:structural maintenance of chromosomes protein 2-2-like isoform X1 [Magnolia sinica]
MQMLRGKNWKMSLEKRVNKKVMTMFKKAEDEYNDLLSKKNIIEVYCYISQPVKDFIFFSSFFKLNLFKSEVVCLLYSSLAWSDKSKIKKVIEELDEKKETLKVAWVKVNKLTS